jgi:hypothetical protein
VEEQRQDPARERARQLKVNADENRFRNLGLLAEESRIGKELVEQLGLSAPTVSHHMRKLVDAGIVTAVPDATMQRYSLNTDLLLDLRRTPLVAEQPRDEAAGSEEDAYRQKVLRNFFVGERLKSIPAQRKQRVVVLQHLLAKFAPEQTYTEREVNDILRVAHDDVASLRRELVDYGFMTRERGIYRVARSTPPRSRQVAQEITGDERRWLADIIASAAGKR